MLDTKENQKTLEKFAKTIEAKLTLGEFYYEDFFPSSKRNIAKAAELGLSRVEIEPVEGEASDEAISSKLPTSRQGKRRLETPFFNDFAEQFFKEKQIEWRRSHLRNVRSMLDGVFIPLLGDYRLADIDREAVLKLRMTLAKRPGRNGNSTISNKSVNNQMGVFQAIMQEASMRFDLDNPCRDIRPLKLKRTHIEPFSLADVNRILQYVRKDYKNYYITRFFTGMRTGEVDGLKWKYVDFERRQILVRETLVNGQTEYTKNDSSQREIPMLDNVYHALKEQYEATGKLSPYVFCNRNGLPLDHDNVTKRVWYPLLAYLKLNKRRPYETRHTAASLFLASGENPEWVARTLGHSSTEMLFKVYSRYIPNATRQDGSAISQLIERFNDHEKTY